MIEKLADNFLDLFENFTVSRLLYWLVGIPIVAITAFLVYEDVTNSFFLAKLERRTALLRELHSLELNGIRKNDNLSATYEDLVAELSSYRPGRPVLLQVVTSDPARAFLLSSALGFFFVLIGLLYETLTRKSGKSVVGFGAFLIPPGGILAIVVANYWGYMVGGVTSLVAQVAFTTTIFVYYGKRLASAKAAKGASNSRRGARK